MVILDAGWTNTYGSAFNPAATWQQANAVQNQWYPISTPMTDGVSSNVTNDGNGKLTVGYAGVYFMSGALSFASSNNNKQIQFGLSINGAAPIMYFTEDVQTANTFTTHALLRLQALNANDTVQCAIRTTSAGTPTISVLAIRAFTGMWWL